MGGKVPIRFVRRRQRIERFKRIVVAFFDAICTVVVVLALALVAKACLLAFLY